MVGARGVLSWMGQPSGLWNVGASRCVRDLRVAVGSVLGAGSREGLGMAALPLAGQVDSWILLLPIVPRPWLLPLAFCE